uniref:RING-type domain-containing protein n=1 Tax=Romanomermis culicivorax TaxID=13658 RepID=A0A915JX23_ROMCU
MTSQANDGQMSKNSLEWGISLLFDKRDFWVDRARNSRIWWALPDCPSSSVNLGRKNALDALKGTFMCPICYQGAMIDPKACRNCCSLIGCKECVNRSLNERLHCPRCRASIDEIFEITGVSESLKKLQEAYYETDEEEDEV